MQFSPLPTTKTPDHWLDITLAQLNSACLSQGLDRFLDESEYLAMGRSFGSTNWLLPTTMPSHAPPAAIVRREGAFVITLDARFDVRHLLEDRLDGSRPARLELVLRFGKRTLTTGFVPVVDDAVDLSGTFVFATGPDGPDARRRCRRCCRCCVLRCACCACCSDDTLIVSLCEPGIQGARATRGEADLRRRVCCGKGSGRRCLKIFFCW